MTRKKVTPSPAVQAFFAEYKLVRRGSSVYVTRLADGEVRRLNVLLSQQVIALANLGIVQLEQ